MTNTNTRSCPALFIGAPASGQGKTTVTAALARYHREQGRTVRVFKTGPDFLDPMILERASGQAVYQLDLWMGGEAHCRALLYEAAGAADLILIEGVMGLFDGKPSSADLAALFGIPVLAVIDASAMAQTFGAIVHGLAHYRAGLAFAGVVANRVGSAGHADMLAESMSPDTHWCGALSRDPALSLPDRHLGLVQAAEIADLETRLTRAAAALGNTALTVLPAPVHFKAATHETPPRLLSGVRIAVARDAAFAFLYRANLDLLRAMGAELCFFSPLTDTVLPQTDSLYLPGGYPELHLDVIERNEAMKTAIRAHQDAGKPIVAECGGMLYLLESLTDVSGRRASMAGVLPGHAVMRDRLAHLGMHAAPLAEGELRGHSFHYSEMETPLTPVAVTLPSRSRARAEPVFCVGRLHASYLHLYLPSNPQAGASLFTP